MFHRALVLAGLLLAIPPAWAQFGTPRLQTVTREGVAGDGSSYRCSLSDDGTLMSFESSARNLSDLPEGSARQVFLLDRNNRHFIVASKESGAAGAIGDNTSGNASVAAQGRFVVFESLASNLSSDENSGSVDIFRYDRVARTTELLSFSTTTAHTSYDSLFPTISGDGTLVGFLSQSNQIVSNIVDDNYLRDVFVTKREGKVVQNASLNTLGATANSESDAGWPVLAPDGSFIVFGSRASDLISSDTNGVADVFTRNLTTGVTERISLAPNGSPFTAPARALGPSSVSSDGRYVLFVVDGSPAQLYLRDRTAGTTTLLSQTTAGVAGNGITTDAVISADGSTIAFHSTAGNLLLDAPRGGVFVLNRNSNTLVAVDVDAQSPCLNGDGTVVGYEKLDRATAAVQLYVRRTDICPTDSNKDEPLACGCNKPETDDTDDDGTVDCIDECPVDSEKTAPLTCGCGVSDEDANANGGADCVEAWFRATTPKVRVKDTTALVSFKKVPGVSYELTLQKGKGQATIKVFTKSRVKISKLKRGKYRLSYRMIENSSGTPVYGQRSSNVTFSVVVKK